MSYCFVTRQWPLELLLKFVVCPCALSLQAQFVYTRT